MRALAAAGRHDDAERVAHSITKADDQSQALADVVRELASAGRVEYAERLAGSVTDPDDRAAALVEVARALVRSGHAQSASRVAVAACIIGRWTIATELMPLIPSAYTLTVVMLQAL